MDLRKHAVKVTASLALVGAGIFAGLAIGTAPAASGLATQEAAPASMTAAEALPQMVPQGLFVEVAEQTSPAVVFIEAERPSNRPRAAIPERFQRFFDDFFRDNGEDAPPEEEDAPGFEDFQESQGSGVIVSSDGYVLTNAHVVATIDLQTQSEVLANNVRVILDDESYYDAEIIGADLGTDIALLKIDAEGLPYAPLGDSDEIRVGEWVMAVGAPFGLQNTVSAGIISALGRAGLGGGINTPYQDFIQTDAAINPGNSGGPLVNLQGQVVGINTAIASGGGLQPAFAGVGFAVPANLARTVMEQLRTHGRVIRGYLGVTVQPVDREQREGMGLPPTTRGAVINSVTAGGPADQGGLRVGDVVVGVNGERLESQQDFLQRVANTRPGDTIELEVLRAGESVNVSVTLGTRPDEASIIAGNPGIGPGAPQPEAEEEDEPRRASIGALGLEITALTPELAQRLRLDEDIQGVVIANVQPNSPAARAGLSEGDVIQQVRYTDVTSVSAFQQAMEAYGPGDVVSLYVFVRQQNASLFLPLQIPR